MSKLWLKIPAAVRAQLVRFGRLFGATFGVQFLAAGEPLHWKVVCALVVAAAETVFRQLYPSIPIPKALTSVASASAPSNVTLLPAIPPDDEQLYLSGNGIVTYAAARASALAAGMQVIVSSTVGGPEGGPQLRSAYFAPIVAATPS